MSLYKKIGIYGIRNKENGMTYVGQTLMDFGDRRDSHFALLRSGSHSNKLLQKDWSDFGEDQFEFIIIEEVSRTSSKEEADSLEQMHISKLREDGLAYNIADGGRYTVHYGKHLSEETKRKIGEKNRVNMTGRKASDETKAKMSDSQRRRFENMSDEERAAFGRVSSERASGYEWSDDAKARFSSRQQTYPNGAKYDVDTVKRIRSMHEVDGMTVSEIADALSIPRHTVYQIATYRRWKNV